MAQDRRVEIAFAQEPTDEQCSANAVLYEDAERVVFAAWHPQWGGYAGQCVVDTNRGEGACFDVHVWHDGEFPRHNEPPRVYHYCDAEQLIEFAELVQKRQVAQEDR